MFSIIFAGVIFQYRFSWSSVDFQANHSSNQLNSTEKLLKPKIMQSTVLITDYGHPESVFFRKSQTFGLGQTNWAKKFGGIWGTLGQTISPPFGTVCSLSMFSLINHYF